MLCRRSASFTNTTRTSLTIASSILRTFSAWRASGASRSRRLILVTPSTRRATSGPKSVGELFERDFGVFDDVVQERGAQRRHVELHVRQRMRHFKRMGKIGLAGEANLPSMMLGGEIVGAAQQREVVAGAILANLVHQLDEAQVHRPLGSGAHARQIGRRFHFRGLHSNSTACQMPFLNLELR